MKSNTKLLKWTSIAGAIFVIQTLTFYLIAGGQLREELLPEYLQLNESYDSAFVTNLPNHLEDPPIYQPFLSHNLKSDEEEFKQKLNVKFIFFGEDPHDESIEKSFNVSYETWYQRWDWLTLSNFFKMTQIEKLTVGKAIYEREVTYQWVLFFWIKRYELLKAYDLSATLPKE